MDLINGKGQPRYGWLREPVERVNYRDFDLRTVMDRRRSKPARYWAFNQFQFVGLTGPDWIAGLAVVDLRWLATAFAYLHDRRSGETYRVSARQPLALGTDLGDRPDHSRARFRSRRLAVDIEVMPPGRSVKVRGPDGLAWDLDLGLPAATEPLRVCSPAGYGGWSYTQKNAGLSVEGRLAWRGHTWMADGKVLGSLDWSAGFMRRETAWNWAALSGQDGQGRRIGLNLAVGINESGVTENAFWVDGVLEKLAIARFSFDRYEPSASWAVDTTDGQVSLRFQPEGCHSERINAGLVASNFRQFFGTFDGELRRANGEIIQVRKLTGFMEDHYARW